MPFFDAPHSLSNDEGALTAYILSSNRLAMTRKAKDFAKVKMQIEITRIESI
jgi:hypothetical protein